ncbi:MAG: 2'-5' RNA ligase family protein [Gaiellaceae bacterium]
MPRTALIVPVPEADDYYQGMPGVPAHVTVLFPFVDGNDVDETAVQELLSRFEAFDFELDRIERFDNGLPWLHPEPSAPFEELTAAVWERWPDHPPYEGEHEVVIPHVTITRGDVPVPFACQADEVRLIEEGADGTWTTRRSFALRQGVA